MSQTLNIVRGLPGSGKSTHAKSLGLAHHYENDMFHMVNGVYTFVPANAPAAKLWCLAQVTKALEAGHDVVVSNTFTTQLEMNPYIEVAKRLNIVVKIHTCRGTWQNQHDVPDAVIAQMKARWEEITT